MILELNNFVKKNVLKISLYFYRLLFTPNECYDLTIPITSKTPTFPGDPAFQIEQIESMEKGSSYNLCYLHLNNHMGTHIDYPAHVIKEGKMSHDYSLADHIGTGIVIDVPTTQQNITREFVLSHSIQKRDIVFFRTKHASSNSSDVNTPSKYLTTSGADQLIQNQIRMVGIDDLSVDNFTDEKLPVHNLLLKNNVLIVENLDLSQIQSGRFSKISIIPPNIPNMDGLPVRAFANN